VVLVGAAAPPSGYARGISDESLSPVQKAHVSGALAAALGSSNAGAKPAGNPTAHAAAPACNTMAPGEEGDEGDDACAPGNFAPAGGGGGAVQNYQPSGQDACAEKRGDNVKVNQNCQNVSDPDVAGRGQAQKETAIAIDPNNKNHVIASQNDYRRGDGNCYGAYSLDGGGHWNDTTIPMSFTRDAGARQLRHPLVRLHVRSGDDERQVQPELVRAAVHRGGREPLRRVGELQHRDGEPGEHR
jgi:hypothetical protein